MNWHTVIARAITMLLSWMDHANLRNRVYQQSHRIEILETAISDIDRINSHSSSPNPLIAGVIDNTKRV